MISQIYRKLRRSLIEICDQAIRFQNEHFTGPDEKTKPGRGVAR